jgi:hypothetical protein
MTALKVPIKWKAPWRMPVGSTQMIAEVPVKNQVRSTIQYKFQKTLLDFRNILRKHWLHD